MCVCLVCVCVSCFFNFPPHPTSQVSKSPVRVVDFFKDYDKLRSGKITAAQFRRALDLCNLGLSENDFVALEGEYKVCVCVCVYVCVCCVLCVVCCVLCVCFWLLVCMQLT